MGFLLPKLLVTCGVRFDELRSEPNFQRLGEMTLAEMLPMVESRLVENKITTTEEISLLIGGIRAELADPTNVYMSQMAFCAWGRKQQQK